MSPLNNDQRLLSLWIAGPSGAGKSTLAAALARADRPFIEADHYHSVANKTKMRQGQPLSDQDRWPWLQAVAEAVRAEAQLQSVVACSALKYRYRQRLRQALPNHRLVFFILQAPIAVLTERVRQRAGHFMPASLVSTQLASLQGPQVGEGDTYVLDARQSLTALQQQVYQLANTEGG